MQENQIYCPICGKTLTAVNEVYDDEYGWIFQHDDISHDDSDILALGCKIQ